MCSRTGDVLGLRQVYERLDEGGLAGITVGCDEYVYVCEFFNQVSGICAKSIWLLVSFNVGWCCWDAVLCGVV